MSEPPYFDELVPMLTAAQLDTMREQLSRMRRKDFLREVERRAGASRDEMLAEITEFERYAYPLKEKLPLWLRRILGEKEGK